MKTTIRKIPLSTQCSILFRNLFTQFGLFFFGFGLVVFCAFATNADFSQLLFQVGHTVEVQGIIMDSYNTNGSEDEEDIFGNDYKFTAENGFYHVGVSYSLGYAHDPGTTVTVEYPEGKPQYSRIKGMKRKMFGPGVLFVAIFPLVGLCIAGVPLKNALKAINLLKVGLLTQGKLIGKHETNMSVNDDTVYRMTFRFRTKSGEEIDASIRTRFTQALEDDEKEYLLYHEKNPKNIVLMDSLPIKLSGFPNGIAPIPLGSVLPVCLVPFAVITGVAFWLMVQFV